MGNLLEITKENIADLRDDDLRNLIGRLCEADYRSKSLNTKGITWSGSQDASDGGIDVMVNCKSDPPENSFIPNKLTGFQVKKAQMTPVAIKHEMMPNGILREEIKKIIGSNGAYIIVSSGSSTSHTALKLRIVAMQEAIKNEGNIEDIQLDFYDCGRIATWVRNHPSLILWVQDKLGKGLNGWKAYENWANCPIGIKDTYLLDNSVRLYYGNNLNEGMSALDGIIKLRSVLSVQRASVRLAGLSGVGKTRLVQALFDSKIGAKPLDPLQVFYTDISFAPNPEPTTFAEQLIASNALGVLIVDNCTPDLHSRLTRICSSANSQISLITIEYDVRENVPENTKVFKLEPASEAIIEKLIIQRFKHIGPTDARHIAINSGGNARIAIAIANTVSQGETISQLRDEELFTRLFQQRDGLDTNLLRSSQAFSLIYSFDGIDIDSDKSELKVIGSLVQQTPHELYRNIALLKDKDLIQVRDKWRAVLPHAIANKLAKQALNYIPKRTIADTFLSCNNTRLIKSFSRRISFLHDSPAAIEIATDWLDSEGWLGKTNGNFTDYEMEVFQNIAPLNPEKTVEAIERFATCSSNFNFLSRESNAHHYEYARILRFTAYDSILFLRSVRILIGFVRLESLDENRGPIREILKSLFYVLFSGTHATIELKTKILTDLLESNVTKDEEIGLLLLDTALDTFDSPQIDDFGFGARSRDYGFYPKSRSEITKWFANFVDLSKHLSNSNSEVSMRVRKVFAKNLRGLWMRVQLYPEIEDACISIHLQKPWNEGWLAIKGILRYDEKAIKGKVRTRTQELEAKLKPTNLLERARSFIVDTNFTFDLDDDYSDDEDSLVHLNKIEKAAYKIGIEISNNGIAFETILSELVNSKNHKVHCIGQGLAMGSMNKNLVWKSLYEEFNKSPEATKNINLLRGFLYSCAKSDNLFFQKILNSLINDENLGQYQPIFETCSTIDARSIKRLHKALAIGKAKAPIFQYLAWGRAHEAISDNELAKLLKSIIKKENGYEVAIEILNMRFHENPEDTHISKQLLAISREALSEFSFKNTRGWDNVSDYKLGRIIKVAFNGIDAEQSAMSFAKNIDKAMSYNAYIALDFTQALNGLAITQPLVFLDVFIGKITVGWQQKRLFLDSYEKRENPMNKITDDILIHWSKANPKIRYLSISSRIKTFKKVESGIYEWRPIMHHIFDSANDIKPILESLEKNISPWSWSGSKAHILESRLPLFKSLKSHQRIEISDWAIKVHSKLEKEIDSYLKYEQEQSLKVAETFE